MYRYVYSLFSLTSHKKSPQLAFKKQTNIITQAPIHLSHFREANFAKFRRFSKFSLFFRYIRINGDTEMLSLQYLLNTKQQSNTRQLP
jgi:hypothetical protein